MLDIQATMLVIGQPIYYLVEGSPHWLPQQREAPAHTEMVENMVAGDAI